ncbi:MAG: hypothetical protein IT216_14095 [Saprospiraceae bacterium]|nr:hypothetical protein [Saprospiraceae bacterium]
MNAYRISGILITLALLFFGYRGELIDVNEGAGWDGRLYASYTAHLDRSLEEKAINSYRFQRVLMSVVINKVMKAMDIPFTVPNIVAGFRLFNLLLLMLGLLYYYLISRRLKLSAELEFLGLAALFWCYPVLKMPFFNPIITDAAAFTMGLMVTYHFLCNHRIVNVLLILAGSFIFPTFILFGLLLLFPAEEFKANTSPKRAERFVLPALFLIAFVVVYFGYQSQFADTYSNINPTNRKLLPVSFLLALGYMYLIGTYLPDFSNFRDALSKVKWIYLVPIVLIILFIKYMTATYTSPNPENIGGARYFINIVKQSVANPGVFLVSHIIYFGWLPLMLVFAGKEMVNAIRSLGYGVAILFAGVGFMSLGSESRQLINFYPLFVVAALLALQKKQALKPWVLALFGVSSLVLSRFWYSITGYGDLGVNLTEWPAQRYFQVFGPWMSNSTYAMNLFICLIAAVAIFILQKTGNLFDPISVKSVVRTNPTKKRR